VKADHWLIIGLRDLNTPQIKMPEDFVMTQHWN